MSSCNNDGLFNQRTLDAMALVGFMIGLANYGENIDRLKAQDMLNEKLAEVHGHLAEQDEKINHIIELLEGGK